MDSLKNFSKEIKIEALYKNVVQTVVPVYLIESLSNLSYVDYMRSPIECKPSVVSEGVGVIGADQLHDIGYYCDGVKVAIIDAGFKGYASDPEIPSDRIKEIKSFRSDGLIETSEHGTACAEIVLDVVPYADLYLYVVGTSVEFCNALNYAVSQGVDVVSVSFSFLNTNDLDGSSYIDEAVNSVRDAGVLVCVSAGNYADSHYCGWYVDNDGDNLHDFDTGNNFLSLGHIPQEILLICV